MFDICLYGMNYARPLKKGVATDARTRMTTQTILKMLLAALMNMTKTKPSGMKEEKVCLNICKQTKRSIACWNAPLSKI